MGDRNAVLIEPVFLRPGRRHALGATFGQDCMLKLGIALDQASKTETALILDLTSVAAVNGSFLKATLFWALQCGQVDVQSKPTGDSSPWAPRPLKLYPAVTGCSKEVADEVEEFFNGRRAPIMHLEKSNAGKSLRRSLLGTLDPLLERTLSSLEELGGGTAAELAARNEDKISVSGWSNRLADLHLLRLATRVRQGKFLIYQSAAKAISSWD